jgi:sec-independent protein translocase protein TatA
MAIVFGFLDLPPAELLIVGVLAILLFGQRLPEVARRAGRGLMEFKKGVQGIREELEAAATGATRSVERTIRHDEADREEATAPKFEPPPSEPLAEAGAAEGGHQEQPR